MALLPLVDLLVSTALARWMDENMQKHATETTGAQGGIATTEQASWLPMGARKRIEVRPSGTSFCIIT